MTMPSPFKLCYITDRRSLPDDSLPRLIRNAIDAGIEMIQIREKDLGTRPLLELIRDAVSPAEGKTTLITVNDRLDIAWAAGAAGVHLGGHSLPAAQVHAVVPEGFLVGVSCHSVQGVLDAQSAGADYVFLGPIFETPSKLKYGRPLGLAVLREAASAATVPVYALGGITVERAAECMGAGASGIAAIRMFQDAVSIVDCLAEFRRRLPPGRTE